MVSFVVLVNLLSLLVLHIHARSAPTKPSVSEISDGKTVEYGTSDLPSGIKEWQSTGIMYRGCSNSAITIAHCYNLTLTSNAHKQLDPGFPSSPRQRIEFRGDSQTSGTSITYTWKHYLAPTVGTSTHFFHLMQIFDESGGTPVITLDALSNKLQIQDYARSSCGGKCPSVPLNTYHGRTTLHTMKITFGPKGSLWYVVADATTKTEILTYEANGAMGGESAYLKFGIYRAAFEGMTSVDAAAGDFSFSRNRS